MENDYRITKLHGTLIGDNRIPDLPVGETAKILSSIKGKTAWVDLPEGGKSVPPTLILSTVSDDDIIQRTSITEEEKTNIENGLYNSVFYIDSSLGESGLYSAFFPETVFYLDGQFGFSTYAVSASDAGDIAITGSWINFLNIGKKSADGTYPITIQKLLQATFGGGISSDGGGDQILIDQDLSEDFGSLFKRVTGFVSTYQTPTSVAFEALGFINENGFGDLSKASVLSFVSTTGKSQWIDPSTNTKYNYQLPKKSGTIALTSDLSEAGTSVTIRRW